MRWLLCGAACLLTGIAAWNLARNQGRTDSDERVSAMLPAARWHALWDPEEAVQAFAFGGQAMLGVALFWFGAGRARRRRK